MRRRRTDKRVPAPKRLLRFDPSEWPADNVRDAGHLWEAERVRSYRENGVDTQLGDPLQVLRGNRALRNRLMASEEASCRRAGLALRSAAGGASSGLTTTTPVRKVSAGARVLTGTVGQG
ncbi:MAG: hypothetical protein QOJ32_3129 [Frankiaceae bacterium]|nr:hypothetical protein [Frankiaceae bacterium]